MSPAFPIALAVFVLVIFLWSRWRRLARAEFIRSYRFPVGLLKTLEKKHPALRLKDQQLVASALRQFFLAYLNSGQRFVSMPSQVTDDLWHEFILYTREYQAFCKKAFGRFMHHTPAVVLNKDRHTNTGLRRTWWYTCRAENIDPRRPLRLPLLFAIDRKLGIADGFVYEPDCRKLRETQPGAQVHCGGDFSDSSFDGTTDGFAESEATSESGADGCGGGD